MGQTIAKSPIYWEWLKLALVRARSRVLKVIQPNFILVYTGIQQVDNLWLRPQLLGRSLRLHPGVVLVSLIAALALSGLLGALIIVPLLATVKIVFMYLHARWLGMSYWPEPASPPETGAMTSENRIPQKDGT